jgi:hypothetical protein
VAEPPPKPAETPHASSHTAATKKPKAANPVIAPEPIDVEEDGDMNPRITPTVPVPAEATPPADAPTTAEPEEKIWDAPPTAPAGAAPTETPPAATSPTETPPAAAPTETPPAATAPAEPAPSPAPAEPTPSDPPATEPAPAN